MATVRLDIEDFINDGYEFPATGGTLEIYCEENGDLIAASSLSQEAGSSPAPVWEDGQHKIYRSGSQVMKMYRNGELIYLRLNPPTE